MIALLTDFGYTDHFVGVLKGVIKNLHSGIDIIDICHSVQSYSIVNAQYILYSSYRYFPPGTIFCVIVDPGVGTDRKGLIARDDRFTYVLPDNGIISAVMTEAMKLFHVNMALFSDSSATFHGRDVFAPIAAGLAMGFPPEEYGVPAASIVRAPFPEYSAAPGEMRCDIVHIDTFGNAITSLPADTVDFEACSVYSVASERYQFHCICIRSYGDLFRGQCGIIQGSSGLIELAINTGSITDRHGMRIGDRLIFTPLTGAEQCPHPNNYLSGS